MLKKIRIQSVSLLQMKSKPVGCVGRFCALRKKICSVIVEVPADMLAAVALAEWSVELERQVTKGEHTLGYMERRFQV